jgi:hypothetical protein
VQAGNAKGLRIEQCLGAANHAVAVSIGFDDGEHTRIGRESTHDTEIVPKRGSIDGRERKAQG